MHAYISSTVYVSLMLLYIPLPWFHMSFSIQYYYHNFLHCSVRYMPNDLIHHVFTSVYHYHEFHLWCGYLYALPTARMSLLWPMHMVWLRRCYLCISCASILYHDSRSWLGCLWSCHSCIIHTDSITYVHWAISFDQYPYTLTFASICALLWLHAWTCVANWHGLFW